MNLIVKKKLMNKLSSIVKILIHSFEFRMNQFDEGVNIDKWEYNIRECQQVACSIIILILQIKNQIDR